MSDRLTDFPIEALKTERERIGEVVGRGMLWAAKLDAAIAKLESKLDDDDDICRHCDHPVEQHCGHDMMCNHLTPDDSPEGGTYCNCWDSDA
jgi:hypothetical protein